MARIFVPVSTSLLLNTPGYYRPRTYGAVAGETQTAQAPAFRALLADMPASGGVLLIDDTYVINSEVVISKPVTLLGLGGNMDYFRRQAPSRLISYSPTANVLRFDHGGISGRGFSIENWSSTVPTAGAGIIITSGQPENPTTTTLEYYGGFRLREMTVFGFYDNINIINAYTWAMDAMYIFGMVRRGINVENRQLIDGGDAHITNSFIFAGGRGGSDGIYQSSSGGLGIVNTKFNSSGSPIERPYALPDYAPGARMNYAYRGGLAAGIHTSVLLITGCSMEAQNVSAIQLYNYQLVNFTGNEFARDSGTGPLVDMNNISNFNVSGNLFHQNSVPNALAVRVTNSFGNVKGLYENNSFGHNNELWYGPAIDASGTLDFSQLWPGRPSAGTAAASVTITAVAVSGNSVTITATTANTTLAAEYSMDGTNYQASNTFATITNGSYSLVRARLVSTNIFYTWPQTVVVPTAAAATPSPASVTITAVTVSGNSVTITATTANTTLSVEYSEDGTNYQTSNTFANTTSGSYNLVRARLAGTTTVYTWPQTVNVPSAPAPTATASVTITAVTVSYNSVTIKATTANTTLSVEYSMDGTNYQAGSTFANVTNGSYNLVRARLVGTTTVYTWPQTVVTPTTPPAAGGGATITITAVAVTGSSVAITASTTNTTLSVEYSMDGTNYQAGSTFTNTTSGSYNLVRARLVGTSTFYTWPQTVVV